MDANVLGPLPSRPSADAESRMMAGGEVLAENVRDPVGVVRYQIAGRADEHHIAAIGADRSVGASAVRFGLAGAGRDADDLSAIVEVLAKDIDLAVGVARHQIVGSAREYQISAVRAEDAAA